MKPFFNVSSVSVIVLGFEHARAFAPSLQLTSSQCGLTRLGVSRSSTSDYLISLTADSSPTPPHVQPHNNNVCERVDESADNRRSDDTPPLQSGDVMQMTWNGEIPTENAFRVGLPPNLLNELRNYANRMGITDFYRGLVVEDRPYNPGTEGIVTFRKEEDDDDDKDHHRSHGSGGGSSSRWMVQRPKSHWNSNMHWVSPADESAHDDLLRVLGRGGFDQVLEKLGTYFDLEGLSAYHLSFIGVSHCEKGFIHSDVNDSGRKAFNMIIPLILEDGAGPELEVVSDDEAVTRKYKYEYNVASMLGDEALHGTGACDYRQNGGMRMAATVYVGDITPTNVNHLLLSLTQVYPPVGNAQHLLDRAGSHWSKSNPSKKLPVLVLNVG